MGIHAARRLDTHLGNDKWKQTDEYAYYDYETLKRAKNQLRSLREAATENPSSHQAVDELKALVESCTKNNFAGIENPRIYSETYYGTKDLAQEYVDELERSLSTILTSPVFTDVVDHIRVDYTQLSPSSL